MFTCIKEINEGALEGNIANFAFEYWLPEHHGSKTIKGNIFLTMEIGGTNKYCIFPLSRFEIGQIEPGLCDFEICVNFPDHEIIQNRLANVCCLAENLYTTTITFYNEEEIFLMAEYRTKPITQDEDGGWQIDLEDKIITGNYGPIRAHTDFKEKTLIHTALFD